MNRGVGVVSGAGVVGDGAGRRRQVAVDEARHSIEMEGGRVSDAVEADAARYVAGELSSEELLERVRRRHTGLGPSAGSGSLSGG